MGATIEAQAEILPEGTHLRMTRDRILVRPLEWEPSRIISVVRRGRPLRGVVVSVGPGRYHRIYARDKSSFRETTRFIPTQLKPGDVVELGGLNVFDGQGYSFPQVIIGTQVHLICQEQDVAFVHEPETPRISDVAMAEITLHCLMGVAMT